MRFAYCPHSRLQSVARLRLHTTDQRSDADPARLHRRRTARSGGPNQHVGWDAIAAKFRDCVSFAAKPIAAKNIDRAIELVRDLEN